MVLLSKVVDDTCFAPLYRLSPFMWPALSVVDNPYTAALVGNAVLAALVAAVQAVVVVAVKLRRRDARWVDVLARVRAPSVTIGFAMELYTSTAPAIVGQHTQSMEVCLLTASCAAGLIVRGIVALVPWVVVVVACELLVRLGRVQAMPRTAYDGVPLAARVLVERSCVHPAGIGRMAGAVVGRDRAGIVRTAASNGHMWPGAAMLLMALSAPWVDCRDQYVVGGVLCAVLAVLYAALRPFSRVVDWAAHVGVFGLAAVLLICAAVLTTSRRELLAAWAVNVVAMHSGLRMVCVLAVGVHDSVFALDKSKKCFKNHRKPSLAEELMDRPLLNVPRESGSPRKGSSVAH